MSGGFAYVLDEKGDFAAKRCNLTSVDLVPMGEDEQMVRSLVEKHVAATGSPRGEWVLENWIQMLPRFIKVYPRDLRALLVAPKKEAIHA
jgi:glutamate synthase domain-containing protein 3